jgi:hypothetical protein
MSIFSFSFPSNLTLEIHALLHRDKPQTHLETSFRSCLISVLLESSLRTAVPNMALSFFFFWREAETSASIAQIPAGCNSTAYWAQYEYT